MNHQNDNRITEDSNKASLQLLKEIYKLSSDSVLRELTLFFRTKAHHFSTQSACYSMGLFETQAKCFLSAFKQEWIHSFKQLKQNIISPNTGISQSDLDLMEEGQFQEELKLKEFILDFKKEHQGIVDTLMAGFSNAFHCSSLREAYAPFLPLGLAGCLIKAFQAAKFDPRLESSIQEALATDLYPKFSGLYWSTKKYLEAQGVSFDRPGGSIEFEEHIPAEEDFEGFLSDGAADCYDDDADQYRLFRISRGWSRNACDTGTPSATKEMISLKI